jgi:hypothetical protein
MHTRADAADIYIGSQGRKTKREGEDESSCILYSIVDEI